VTPHERHQFCSGNRSRISRIISSIVATREITDHNFSLFQRETINKRQGDKEVHAIIVRDKNGMTPPVE
jgi:hypothetical protein